METLEELKDKYYKLDAERYDLFREIIKLESQETLKKVNIGDCFINTRNEIIIKIVAVKCKELHCLYINRDKICLAEYMPDEIIKKRWKKITSKQFDTLLDAILKDFQSNETNEVRKNWDIVYHRISLSICQWNVR